MAECTADAYAKINIGLKIGPRKADGYHDIVSIFQSVSLHDTITFRTTAKEGELSIQGIADCHPRDTSIAKAVMALREKIGVSAGISIDVIKRIPVMAGMGGGSADAAATLVALDQLFGLRLPREELVALSCKIGADVPFFLYGGAAIVSGIGEVIQPIESRTDIGFLVLDPGFGISTAEAYTGLDRFRAERTDLVERQIAERLTAEGWESWYWGKITAWPFHNSFEPMLEKEHASYAILRRLLQESGAGFVSITGSGACMFGAYERIEDASAAIGRFMPSERLPGLRVHALQPLETSIVLR